MGIGGAIKKRKTIFEKMKVICISDSHSKHHEIPSRFMENADGDIDMCIHAGDVSSRGDEREILQFMEWYSKLPFKYKILIAGNHDFYFERATSDMIERLLKNYPEIIYLNDSGVEIEGFKIWGSPVQPWFYNWAFNRMGIDIQAHWDLIPSDTQLLITHGPIQGYLDMTTRGDITGCPYLKETINARLKDLKLHVCGHIHEAYGRIVMADGQVLLNASVLNHRYEMQNRPITMEWFNSDTIDCGYINVPKNK